MSADAGPSPSGGTRGVVVVWGAFALVLLLIAILLWRYSPFIDAVVYERAATDVVQGRPLYEPDPAFLPFVYPPFAAVLFLPLAAVPGWAGWVLAVVSLASLGRVCWLLAPMGASFLPAWISGRGTSAAALFVLLVMLEPSVETLRLGQIGLLLLWLVVEDLQRTAGWSRGALTGVAAALKIVPGFFLLFYAVVGRWRWVLTGATTFLVCTAVAWIALPADSARFWLQDLFRTSRVGAPVDFVGNQSLLGVWTRATGSDPSGSLWWSLAMAGVIAAGLWLCRRLWVAGQELVAFGVAGLIMLLVSPVSWTHHWVFFFPLLVALAAGRPQRWVSVVVVVSWLVLLSRVVWRAPTSAVSGVTELWWWPVSNAYVLVGLAAGAAALSLVVPHSQRAVTLRATNSEA